MTEALTIGLVLLLPMAIRFYYEDRKDKRDAGLHREALKVASNKLGCKNCKCRNIK